MVCLLWRKPPPPLPVNPNIQIKHRHLLSSQPWEERCKEKGRLVIRLNQKRIDFEEGRSSLSAHAVEVLRNVADVLFEWPEVELLLEGHAGRERVRKKDQLLQLSMARAEACRDKLLELGVVSSVQVTSRGGQDSREVQHGCVKIRASEEARLLEPQERLDMILSRASFDFLPQTYDLSDMGLKVAELCSRVLRETENRVFITVPKNSSDLALKRAEAIGRALQETGMVTAEIRVKRALGQQDRATLTIDDTVTAPELGPQDQLVEILKETPLAFRANSAELVPDVVPVVKRCAAVLREVKYMSCLVEAYCGPQSYKDLHDGRLREMMLERAQRIVDWFKQEGVQVPLYAKGYSTPYSGSDEGVEKGLGGRGPRIVVTLVQPGEEELDPLIEVTENEGSTAWLNLGCM